MIDINLCSVLLLLTASINAAPPASVDASNITSTVTQEKAATHNDTPGPVKYDGAQLWRIPYEMLHERNAVADLQNTYGK